MKVASTLFLVVVLIRKIFNLVYKKKKYSTLYLVLVITLRGENHSQNLMRNLTVVNTHKGLFRFLHLPFGISSAPAIFQLWKHS